MCSWQVNMPHFRHFSKLMGKSVSFRVRLQRCPFLTRLRISSVLECSDDKVRCCQNVGHIKNFPNVCFLLPFLNIETEAPTMTQRAHRLSELQNGWQKVVTEFCSFEPDKCHFMGMVGGNKPYTSQAQATGAFIRTLSTEFVFPLFYAFCRWKHSAFFPEPSKCYPKMLPSDRSLILGSYAKSSEHLAPLFAAGNRSLQG